MRKLLNRNSLRLLTLLSLFIASSGCGTGPKVTVCLVDVASGGLQCSDPENNVEFIPFAQADGFVSMRQTDFKKILDYMATKCVRR